MNDLLDLPWEALLGAVLALVGFAAWLARIAYNTGRTRTLLEQMVTRIDARTRQHRRLLKQHADELEQHEEQLRDHEQRLSSLEQPATTEAPF